MNLCYRVNEPHVISEEMGDEIVVINLESGCYYSLNIVASYIWSLIEGSVTLENIEKMVVDVYQVDRETVLDDLTELLEAFVREELIVACERGGENNSRELIKKKTAVYVRPQLEKHDDIQEMLKLDPIHEVAEVGWPRKKD